MALKLYKASGEHFHLIFDILEENSNWLLSQGNNQWPSDWLQQQKNKIEASVSLGNFHYGKMENEMSLVVELLNEPEEIWHYNKENSLYIHKLAINRKFKGLGVGVAAVNEMIKMASYSNYKNIRLDCVAGNQWLCKFYESLGFKFICLEFNGQVDLALYEYSLTN